MGNRRVALGFSVHTGWAAVIAVAGPANAPVVVDRFRIEMMEGKDPDSPRFVYHSARGLRRDVADRRIRSAIELSQARAKEALAGRQNYDAVAAAIIVGDRPLHAALEEIFASHALIHTAEGVLFRGALRVALTVPVVDVPASELRARAAKALGIPVGRLDQRLAAIGKAAGRPWAKDQKDAFLAAVIALG